MSDTLEEVSLEVPPETQQRYQQYLETCRVEKVAPMRLEDWAVAKFEDRVRGSRPAGDSGVGPHHSLLEVGDS